MRSVLIFLVFLLPATSWSGDGCVILLHGLGRSASSMSKIENYMKKQGFVVWNESYPSTEKTIESLALIISNAIQFCEGQNKEKIYFVTHSLGGVLVRQYYQEKADPRVEAVVMLAPPNKGSEVVDEYKKSWWFRRFLGKAGMQLGTDAKSLPNQLKAISLDIGIIAGTVSSDPWFSYLFTGENDGKVSVESTKLDEMRAFVKMPVGHTFIMDSDEVIDQVYFFMLNKAFK
ncbi:MAG: alpha/beta hydrolase [Oligoflexia bacterium]|nr:alpha/beta hydrolase [Oligoflexia bacterium]